MDIEKMKNLFTIPLKGTVKTVIQKEQLEYIKRFETWCEYSFGLYLFGRPIAIVYYCTFDHVWSYVEVLDPVLGKYDRKEIFQKRWDDRKYMKDITDQENKGNPYWEKVLFQLFKEHGYEFPFMDEPKIDD